MGNYATTSDMAERFESDAHLAHLTDTADTTGVSSDTRVNEALSQAEGLMNSYIGRKYKIPYADGDTVVDAVLKSVCLDLAVFFLVARPGTTVTARIQQAYDNALAWLKDIAKGEAVLPASATPTSTATRGPMVAYSTAATDDDSLRSFRRDTMAGV